MERDDSGPTYFNISLTNFDRPVLGIRRSLLGVIKEASQDFDKRTGKE